MNLSFAPREVEVLDRLAEAEGLKLSTYLRRLVLKANRVAVEAGRERRMDAQARLGYVPPHEADRRSGKLGRKVRAETTLEQLAAVVPDSQSDLPFYRSKAARALLQALSPGNRVRAEELMRRLRRQPTLEEYRAAGILNAGAAK